MILRVLATALIFGLWSYAIWTFAADKSEFHSGVALAVAIAGSVAVLVLVLIVGGPHL